jgi:tetratricopeptide (TPR) repeat protein
MRAIARDTTLPQLKRDQSNRYLGGSREVRRYLHLIVDNSANWPKDESARRLVQGVLRSLEAGRYDEALAACRRAIARDRDICWAHGLRATTLLRLDRYSEALATADRALSYDREFPLAHFVRGDALLRLGRYDEALATAEAQDSGWAHCLKADVLLVLGRNDEAVAAAELAVARDKDCSWANVVHGDALYRVGRVDEALAAATRAVAGEVEYNGRGHVLYGVVLASLGRYDEALAAAELALGRDPDDPAMQSVRRAALLLLGRTDEAVAAAELALARDPDDALARRMRDDLFAKIQPLETVAESNTPDYTGSKMDTAAAFAAAARTFSDRELKEYVEKGELAADILRERETTSRSATAAPRANWESDRTPGETPPEFIKRAYAPEIAARTLHKGIIRTEDGRLYDALFNWLRDRAHKLDFELPTKAEWNSRRIEEQRTDPAAQEAIRLYTVSRSRAARKARSPTT